MDILSQAVGILADLGFDDDEQEEVVIESLPTLEDIDYDVLAETKHIEGE